VQIRAHIAFACNSSAMSLPGVLTDHPLNHNGSTSRLPLFSLGAHPTSGGVVSSDIIEALSSSEDGIKKSLIIDMKDLVGEAVGNVRYASYASSSLLSSPGYR
jgi:hypothetical protein